MVPMSEEDLQRMLAGNGASDRRRRASTLIESTPVQGFVIGVILLNALVMGLETSASIMASIGTTLKLIDRLCLVVFLVEIAIKFYAYRGSFFRNGWNNFDFFVVAVALIPGSGPFAVLRSLRVFRILRLFTMVPQLRKVVAAFLHSIPGLLGVVAVMAIFFYTCGVLATTLFGETHPEWFGTLGESLYTLFQIMTLESWSMGIVRPVMEVHPFAWLFFVPFIVIATFTILNLFIGIIVSTMQELSIPKVETREVEPLDEIIGRLEDDLKALREELGRRSSKG